MTGLNEIRIDQHFFDYKSKAMMYVLGTFYVCYRSLSNIRFEFRSTHKNLVEIVKDQLKSKHALISDPRGKSSHWLDISNVPYLNSELEEMGLNVPKSERRFPEDIPDEFMDHFIRGFIDGKANVAIIQRKYTKVGIDFNHQFLIGFHNVLVKYAGVERSKPSGDSIYYSHKDSLRIHDLIYQDWGYIKKHGLYLPSNKEVFRTDFQADLSTRQDVVRSREKVGQAKVLLLQGKHPLETAQELGYSYIGFNRAFKRVTGFSPSKWIRMQQE